MKFDEKYHLNVGYYEDGYDLEAVFFKVKDEEHYQKYEDFGLLINQSNIKEDDMTYEYGALLFKKFLKEKNII
ncbi:DUF3986 family protein [Bacillus sp. Hm123]|uniref:DUF3986 family protein n=1 Tax=Bacillus sp. Hm123 TaxID=3450745 RepID=UPI003F43811A